METDEPSVLVDVNKMCRICVDNTKNNLVDIFSDPNGNDISTAVAACYGISVSIYLLVV